MFSALAQPKPFVPLEIQPKRNMKSPYIIEFNKIGAPDLGYITVSEIEKSIPFNPLRIFWTYETPTDTIRGLHAHYTTEEVLVALRGTITIKIEEYNGTKTTFVLDTPQKGVYLPAYAWFTIEYSEGAVQLAFASTLYKEADYIRDYDEFLKVCNR